jgi:hypothetical protein
MSLGLDKIEKSTRSGPKGNTTPTSTQASLSHTDEGIGIEGEKHYSHRCSTPVGAIQLAEDCERVLSAIHHVERIDPDSISQHRSTGWNDRSKILHALKDWYAFARERLKKDYLYI